MSECVKWQGSKQCWDRFKGGDMKCFKCFCTFHGSQFIPCKDGKARPEYQVALDEGFVSGNLKLQDYIHFGKLVMDIKNAKVESPKVNERGE